MAAMNEPTIPESVLDTLATVREDGGATMMDLHGVIAAANDLDCDPSAILWLCEQTERPRHERAASYTAALRAMGGRRRTGEGG